MTQPRSEYDSVTREDFAALEQRVRILEARLARWAESGLAILDQGQLYEDSGGLFGTDPRAARSDHAH